MRPQLYLQRQADTARCVQISNPSQGLAGVADCGFCWGIKSSSEVSDGMIAVYWFQHQCGNC